ncbi:MAG: hypothetical protein D6686_03440 [Alphaproteobacteria bacterium]|nr:MAG: hypothetical protein D6686_03440 [Alphaproteobacteria bacterium]
MIRAIVNWVAILASLAALIASGLWLWGERIWSRPPAPDAVSGTEDPGYRAFVHGPIGLEIFPLKYAAVIEAVSGHAFRRDGADPRSLWEIYGFLPNPRATGAPLCAANARDQLPYGFTITRTLPGRAADTPVAFVGLTCAACHSGRIRHAGGVSAIIDGMGNPEIDVIGFSEAVRTAVLDPGLTADRILQAYAEQCPGDDPGPVMAAIERWLIAAWLDGFRASVAEGLRRYGLPRWPHGAEIAAPDTPRHLLEPAGPGRTRPFRSVVRVALDLPGEDNHAFSKIPVVFEQRRDLRPRSQFDGSIRDPVVRAFIAAYASGAAPVTLARPEVAATIRDAARWTETLGIDSPVPSLAEIFPDLPAPDPALLAAGAAAYREDCAICHGWRDLETGRWIAEGALLHRHLPLDRIGTDPERVTFPHGRLLPLALWTALPGAGELLAAQRRRLDAARSAALAASRMGEAQIWAELRARLDRSARQFRLGHPLAFAECTGPDCSACAAEAPGARAPDPACALTATAGYYTNPIPRPWLRAPFLHNGSVPTLRQLLNLDDRPVAFCRGANAYDPVAIGLIARETLDPADCPPETPFLFDTRLRGNSNAGHDFPFTRAEVLADPARAARLEAIIAYLGRI